MADVEVDSVRTDFRLTRGLEFGVPFTAAHPLAVVPWIGWRRLDATCLVIGSMAPDFEYFARMKQASSISHTWLGLAIWNLPVTLLLAFAFHRLVKDALVLVAPRWIAGRAAVLARRPWAEPWTLRFAITCVISTTIGAVTHLMWDGFTHADGMMVQSITALREPVELPGLGTMVIHRVLQHTSSLVGMAVLALVIWRALRRIEPVELPDRSRAWPRAIAIASLLVGIALAAVRFYIRPWLLHDLGSVVVILISGAIAGTLIASSLLWNPAKELRG